MSTKGKKRNTNNQSYSFGVDIYKNINKEFRAYLRNSHIGMLSVLSKETTFGRYMLNRKMYEFMLGPYIDISDQYLRIAISNGILSQIEYNMSHYPNTVVGITKYDMMHVCYSSVRTKYYTADENSGETAYFICDIGQGVELDVNSPDHIDGAYLKFGDFDVEGLTRFILFSAARVYNYFITMTRNNEDYPAAYSAIGKTSDIVRMTYELGTHIGADTIAEYADMLNYNLGEIDIQELINKIEEPMIIYFTKLLHVCGVSYKIVNELFENINLHILYNTDGKKLGDVSITYVFESSTMKVADSSVKVAFEFTIKDIIDIAMSSRFTDGTDNVSKTRRMCVGRKIKALMQDLCQVAVAYAVAKECEN